MGKKKKKRPQRTKDYFPLNNPADRDEAANVPLPSQDDIEEAKRWVDETEK